MSKPVSATAPGPLLLASTSRYRRDLLTRLGLPFDSVSPGVDETPQAGESPGHLVRRLALAKATVVASTRPGAVVIGSDQLACRDGTVLGKPGSSTAAVDQLKASSGREVAFLTAVAVLSDGGRRSATHLDVTRVLFRALGDRQIARYVAREAPLDCAGSFKCEGLGISLFERILSSDPTALIGLPLIFTAAALRDCGFAIP